MEAWLHMDEVLVGLGGVVYSVLVGLDYVI
jgi:hypothetical protein